MRARFHGLGHWLVLLVGLFAADPNLAAAEQEATTVTWSASERALLQSLRWRADADAQPDWRNPLRGDPAATTLGERLFHDARFDPDGSVSCATCHRPAQAFQDGLPRARGRGQVARNTPTLLGAGGQRWLTWDGRKDSLWAQALEPLEAAAEIGGSRGAIAFLVLNDVEYRRLYAAAFGEAPATPAGLTSKAASPLGTRAARWRWRRLGPDTQAAVNRAFARLGQALAAYQATLVLPEAPFDCFVDGLTAGAGSRVSDCGFSAAAERGLRLFMSGATGCATCHLGPRFSDGGFRQIGTGAGDGGRAEGLARLAADPFNCAGAVAAGWLPATLPVPGCAHLPGAGRTEVPSMLNSAFRTPSLRHLRWTAPYMHDGRFQTLDAVLHHYEAPPADQRHELTPVKGLSASERADLLSFLESLSGPAPGLYEPLAN